MFKKKLANFNTTHIVAYAFFISILFLALGLLFFTFNSKFELFKILIVLFSIYYGILIVLSLIKTEKKEIKNFTFIFLVILPFLFTPLVILKGSNKESNNDASKDEYEYEDEYKYEYDYLSLEFPKYMEKVAYGYMNGGYMIYFSKDECSIAFAEMFYDDEVSFEDNLTNHCLFYCNSFDRNLGLEPVSINGKKWYFGYSRNNEIGSRSYYATKINDKIYIIDVFDSIESVGEQCVDYSKELMDTIKYK